MSHQEKDQTRVTAGLKAAIRNPNVSEEGKERAAERLQELGTDTKFTPRSNDETDSGLEDYKGEVNKAGNLGEAKELARDFVEGAYDYKRSSGSEGIVETINGKDAGNVLRGYKATITNPTVSEEAKEHADQVLRDHNVI